MKVAGVTKIEGHPDNVAPAIYGNLVVASSVEGQVSIVADFPEVADFPGLHSKLNCVLETAVVSCLRRMSYKEAVCS